MYWWISDKWYRLRMWLAWRIFPEIVVHIKVTERLAVIDENLRIVNAIKDADSACEGWALSLIERKYHGLEGLLESIEETLG
jgi:hypothetical protein